MLSKILIANRGEIACRIMRTAQKLGIQTVAVYSQEDAQSQHVKLADEAYCIGEAALKESYLNIAAILHAAELSGAQAIHPGYGFLSENPEFARACAKANIIFIGPTVEAMEAMASKQYAKQLLEKTSVPLVPGYHGKDQDPKVLQQEARRIGFPVLLKAACGGGGKGMRAVHEESDFIPALEGAQREALSSFGDAAMIIEKLVTNPRHVEVQIMADQQGQVVHLFERDCSIQRRHQKIIEEAPAPGLSPSLRAKMTTAACEVAKTIHYLGAGTVEFLLSDKDEFYFMEMNTRLQVEHPVTEMITGQDLVAWQIAIAQGQPLPLSQDEIKIHGHAIECRIYAEDPRHDFLPSIGSIDYLRTPFGEGIRLDSGVALHSKISKFYDPMIAKLICHGSTREIAVRKTAMALNHYAIGGVKNNIAFLSAILRHPRFMRADLGTDFLSKETLILPDIQKEQALLLAAAFDYCQLHQQDNDLLAEETLGWQSLVKSHWTKRYHIQDEILEIQIQAKDSSHFVGHIADQEIEIACELHQDRLVIQYNKEKLAAWVQLDHQQLTFYHQAAKISVEPFLWDTVDAKAGQPKGQLTAPMPATIVAILKQVGESVKAGERLMVLEAMKMEHTIHAPMDGVLTNLYYPLGAQVNEGAQLLSVEEATS